MAKEAQALADQAQRLRELKKMGRVTVPQIAKAVDVSERQVQRWLAGDSDIDGDNLKKLARYLGTTPDYIEYGKVRRRPRPTPEPLEAPVPDDTSAKILKRLEAIQTQLDQLALDNEARQAELISHIDERTEPTQAAPQRRRRA